jgi:muramoyltetrapeptide carboxypeptidase
MFMKGKKLPILVNPLPVNGTIGIFSPSEPIIDTRISRFDRGLNLLRSYGYNIKLAPHYNKHTSYTAGTTNDRISDINYLLKDPDVDILLESWGGKSCNQLLSLLDYELIKKSKKPILGFSDGSVLLNAITARTNLITFYGPNAAGKMFETEHSKLEFLRSNKIARGRNLLGRIVESDYKVLKPGRATGRLLGGNLSTFALGVVGTSYIPNFDKAIFFWESGGEPPQIIDQFLTFLRNAKVFERISGMVIGDFVRQEQENWKTKDPFAIILDVTSDYKFPIVYNPSFGHANIENGIFPIGALVELDTKQGSLMLAEDIFDR